MRAVTTDQAGTVVVADVPTPEPRGDEVRVRVSAAGVNPIDAYVLAGMPLSAGWTAPGQLGLGWELSGVVEAAGPDAPAHLTPGTRVAALSAGPDKPLGAQAEAVVLPADAIAPVPDDLDLVAAATLPLNGLTAAQALDLAGDPRGTLLVTGAAGAVGAFAISLAAERGWTVLGLAREGDRELVTSLGGTLVTDLAEVDGVAAVLDAATIGEPVLDVVAPGGTVVQVVAGSTPEREGIHLAQVMVQPDADRLAGLLRDTAAGRWPVRVRAEVPLDEPARAYELLAQGGRGRVVLTAG